jgi:hypothetical protein
MGKDNTEKKERVLTDAEKRDWKNSRFFLMK